MAAKRAFLKEGSASSHDPQRWDAYPKSALYRADITPVWCPTCQVQEGAKRQADSIVTWACGATIDDQREERPCDSSDPVTIAAIVPR
jgi:hypothetical protein